MNDINSLIESQLEIKREKMDLKTYETNDLSEPKVEIKKEEIRKYSTQEYIFEPVIFDANLLVLCDSVILKKKANLLLLSY